MCGLVKYVLNYFILFAQLYIDASINKYQIDTPTSNVTDSVHFWCFSVTFKEREGGKKLFHLHCTDTSPSPPVWWAMWIWHGFWHRSTEPTEWPDWVSVCDWESLQGNCLYNCITKPEVRAMNILDLNVCGYVASKQRPRIVRKVNNRGVCHQCHTWNKCSVLCSYQHALHAGDQDTWLGIKLGFHCYRRPKQVALDPLCVQVGFFPLCLLWAVNSPREMSS